MPASDDAYARIFRAVEAIPRGRVSTYGRIAARAGLPGRARQVGFALRSLGDGSVPWHRVVNAGGRLSVVGDAAVIQRRRLLAEGIRFDAHDRIDLERFGCDLAGPTAASPPPARSSVPAVPSRRPTPRRRAG